MAKSKKEEQSNEKEEAKKASDTTKTDTDNPEPAMKEGPGEPEVAHTLPYLPYEQTEDDRVQHEKYLQEHRERMVKNLEDDANGELALIHKASASKDGEFVQSTLAMSVPHGVLLLRRTYTGHRGIIETPVFLQGAVLRDGKLEQN